ncbi:MAG: hypothetical protein A2048_10295 [Deltaproteobacteria bacterium GWA2_45_12]|nr:MAG: hypothetical protein A2048_10295 [Deltaproteobacteria bacterium GWA2_45_12]
MAKYIIFASIFLTPLIFNFSTRELFEFPKMIVIYVISLIAFSYMMISHSHVQKGGERFSIMKPLTALLALNVLSTVFSLDVNTSVFGYYTRFNGGLISLFSYTMLAYFSLTFLLKRDVAESAFWLSLSSMISGLYAIAQHLGIDKDFWVQDSQARAFSTLGQPNWLAAYLLMTLPIPLYFLLVSVKRPARIFYFLTTLITFCGIWFTYSLSGFLGLILLPILILVFFNKTLLKRNSKVIVILITAALLIAISQPGIFSARLKSAFKIIANRLTVVASEQAPSQEPSQIDTSLIRLVVWKGAAKLFASSLKTALIGTGPETFAYAFLPFRPLELNQTTEWDFLYNKAHNYYLDLLTGTGILGVIGYFWFVFAVIKLYRKASAREKLAAPLFIGWLTLPVTNFFGWPVVATSLLFFIFPALLAVLGSDDEKTTTSPRKSFGVKLGALVLFVVTIKAISNIFLADTDFSKASSLSKQGYFSQANLKFSTAAAKNPVEPTYHREYAFNLVQEALSSPDENEQIRLGSTAIVQAETAYRLNPVNSLTLKSLLRTYYGLAKIDPVFEKEVEEYAKRVTALAPSEPKTFYDSALILSYLDKNKEAILYAKKALLLKPDYTEAEDLLVKLSPTDKTKER